MKPKDFIDTRIVIQDCVYGLFNDATCMITEASYNDSGDIILATDIVHPEDRKTFLWINADQIAYIKQYDKTIIQYHTSKGVINTINNNEIIMENGSIVIGYFDVYLKVKPKITRLQVKA